MRSEKRKKYIIMVLALLLVISVPVSYLRVLTAAEYIDGGKKGAILDRCGLTLYDDGCVAPELLGNVLGGNGMIDNALSVRYAQELKASGFSPLVGIESLEGQVGDSMITTLLPVSAQEKLAEAFGEYNGCCFAYNYVTGEVYVMLSLPSSLSEGATDGAYWNRCLHSLYIPGSTMKIVAAICALEQDSSLDGFTYTCTGQEVLADGNTVTCGTSHGTLDLKGALGRSCNCYMAALIQQFDLERTWEILNGLGISQTGNEEKAFVDKLVRMTSRTQFNSTQSFNDVWSLIGQGYTEANVVDMAMIAGAVANGGSVAKPYVVQSIVSADGEETAYEAQIGEMTRLLSQRTANQLYEIWSDAVDTYYRSGKSQVVDQITSAKTGTAQIGNGNTNRMLVGVMEEKNVAFMVVCEDLPSGDPLCSTIANLLAELVP